MSQRPAREDWDRHLATLADGALAAAGALFTAVGALAELHDLGVDYDHWGLTLMEARATLLGVEAEARDEIRRNNAPAKSTR